MFLPFLEKYATGENESLAFDAARQSLALNKIFREGIAQAQEQIKL
jgi:hypothetical protein